jgi:conjugative transposon TraM protein
MKNLNLKQPKYVLPALILPFLFLFFAVYHSGHGQQKQTAKPEAGINANVGDVSANVKKEKLTDKLDAYRNTYKQVDGYTAVNNIPREKSSVAGFDNNYTDQQKKMLDSIDQAMKQRYGTNPAQPRGLRTGGTYGTAYPKIKNTASAQDKALATALSGLSNGRHEAGNYVGYPKPGGKEKDPMELFKQQMAYMDSLNKMNDPVYKAEKQKQAALTKAQDEQAKEKTLSVSKAENFSPEFNTIMPDNKENLIMAVIDEDVTGYVSSRIRLRLLDNIRAGNILIDKGTYLYALISGFSGQRVTLSVRSILYHNRVLPVKLDIYDMDGLPGLYVPESAFRDFTKDLGTNTIQGITIDGGSGSTSASSQLLMSSVDKIFQSTSSAIAGAIRKNKAKVKYNSYIYLIDSQALQNEQNR